ncbi:hypothetical protein, partial [Bacillus cereus group sp. Bce038]
MQSIQGTEAISVSAKIRSISKGSILKWAVLSAVGIVNGYTTILMYSRGELAFAML